MMHGDYTQPLAPRSTGWLIWLGRRPPQGKGGTLEDRRQKTGKGKDPQHYVYVDYDHLQTKAGDGAGPDAGAVAVGDDHLPDGNGIRASYAHAPAGKHSRA
jgi:hypothetical protein